MKKGFEHIEAVTKQDWLLEMEKESKGVNFEAQLVTRVEGISISPLYTLEDVAPKIEVQEIEDEEYFDSEEDEIRETWRPCEEVFFDASTSINDLFLGAFNNQSQFLRISGKVNVFMEQLSKAAPMPIGFTINAENENFTEETVKIWRDYIGNASKHQPQIWGIEFDPIGAMMKSGVRGNERQAFSSLAQLFFKLTPQLHDCKIIKIDTTIAASAGATSTQQLAYALAICNAYFNELSERNVPLEEMVHLVVFHFTVKNDFFLEIAKLKAFSILWLNFLKGWFDDIEDFPQPFIHCTTSIINNSEADAHSNLYRTTFEAMSAILGGAKLVSILPFDTAAQSTSLGDRMARNMHHILRHESFLDQYQNAAEGSYYIESVATQLAENAWEIFKGIEQEGGFLHCLFTDVIQHQILNEKAQLNTPIQTKNNQFFEQNASAMSGNVKGKNNTTDPLVLLDFKPILPTINLT